jgi:integrase
VFYGALRYAVELDHLPSHPMDRVSWTTPKADDEIDQRVVINPHQALGLLKAVEDTDPAMVGFFACMYYAALRPGEVVHLRKENCILPETGWGKLMLDGSTQYAGAWGDNGHGREDRALKHRSLRSVRPVPACPQLVRILRHHLDNYTCGPDGRLFVTRTGKQRHPVSGGYAGPVSGSSYGNTWRRARAAALTKAEAASPLARRLMTCGTPACLFGSTLGCLPPRSPSGPGTASPSFSGSTPSASPGRRTALSSAWT